MQNRTLRIVFASICAGLSLVSSVVLALVLYLDTRFTLWMLLLAIPLAALVFIGAFVLSGILLPPLDNLTKKAKKIAAGDIQVSLEEGDLDAAPQVVRDLAEALEKSNNRLRSAFAEVNAESKRQSQFISDVSHELRTPLTAIRGAAETLMDEDIAPEDRQRFLNTIVFESERLTRLANDLMTLQRIEGDGEIVLKRVNLHDIVEHATDMLEPLLADREVILSISGEAPDVLGDPDRLQQVVQNLVENASRFVGEGGRIHVELSGIKEHSVITVSDNGPGFGDIDPARLFDRFYRGDFSRARTKGGIGLGLAIVKAIVSAHDGTVEAVNLPDKGACFIVAIPSLPPNKG